MYGNTGLAVSDISTEPNPRPTAVIGSAQQTSVVMDPNNDVKFAIHAFFIPDVLL